MTAAPFAKDRLVEAATSATGLDDFGEGAWEEGLDVLLPSLEHEARLNEMGESIAVDEIVGYLENRLRIIDWRAAHPAVAEGAITRPIVIVGQPRTGTTILYDLLAQDPDHRAPQTWEVDHPCPPPQTATYTTDPRIAEVDARLQMTDLLIPGFTAFHPMGAQLAQECVRITGGDFRSMIFSIQYRVPTYNRWQLDDADMGSAYRYHRQFLQHLQSEHPAERWLLKSPAHLWHLPALLAEYPDAVIIQTHRDPLKVVASISALAAHLRQLTSIDPTVEEAAAQYQFDIFQGLDRFMADRDAGLVRDDQVVDVHFTDFVADPLASIGRVYDQLGLALSAEAEAAMRAFLATNPGDGGGGGTRYSFANTGLDPDEQRERARPYQERFGVRSEPVT